ncbi:hypothetical protein ECANGB1_2737 [Enterospora canceri]|uniref:Ig-like domain-containing protein n=1 Tax=Enterospora canceri TaxID=1081671 RepID=A0A1Y1S4C4_9MICR|nr:hypothetical protein ECANGB1_2737 [Enterospora canceri]
MVGRAGGRAGGHLAGACFVFVLTNQSQAWVSAHGTGRICIYSPKSKSASLTHSHPSVRRRRRPSLPWLVQSRQLASLPVGRRLVSNLLRRRLVSPRLPPEVSRSPTVTGRALWLSVKSAVTRRALSCSSGSCPSNVWCARLLRISRLISVSSPLLSWLCRRLPRLTLSVYLRTQTSALSTPSASLSCQRTSSLPAASEASVPKQARVS